MAGRSEEIVDADRKLNFLIAHVVPRRVLGHEATMSDFALRLGVKRETLRDASKSRRLSAALQEALAKKLGFRLDWPEWEFGDVRQFQERYLSAHRDAVRQPGARRLDVQLTRGERHQPVAGEMGLAVVEVDGAQFGVGSANIEVTVSCGMPLVLGVRATVRSGRLDMRCAPALLTKDCLMDWTQGEKETKGSRGPVRVSFEAATRSAPSWRLTAAGPSIGAVVFEPGFAHIEEMAPGDEITVEFGTWLSDVEEETDQRWVDGIAIVKDDGSDLVPPPADLSKRRQRVIECLRKGLLCADSSGYAVLARHVLQVVEAP